MFRSRLVVCIVALFVAPLAQAAELSGPAIRAFDLPTIERLGREMHEQDQWAWKAADVMAAKRSVDERKADGMRGWITGRIDGKPRVPAPNDYKIVVAGYPLYIADSGVGRPPRMGVLEISGGQFRFRITDGPALTDDLVARVGKRLDGFQTSAPAQTVSLAAPAPSGMRAGLTAGIGKFASAGEAEAAIRGKLRQAPVVERVGYVLGSAEKGFEARFE